MKNENLTRVVLLLACIFLTITIILYEIFPAAKIASFASFLSATGTLGILILTAFYVVFTNRQIAELKKQRELQLQPLPNILITEAAIARPILVLGPTQGSIKPVVDIYFKCKIENIGNAAALQVDTIFQINGKALERHYDELWARRFHAIKENDNIYFFESLREISTDFLNVILKSQFSGGCPKGSFFSILLHTKILYRNILGTPFILTLDNLIRADEKHKKTLATWVGIMETFEQEFADKISTYKAVFQKRGDDSEKLYKEINTIFKSKFTDELIPIKVLPWSASFNVKPLENNEIAELEKKICHSLPTNIGTDRIIMNDESPSVTEHIKGQLKAFF